MALVKDDILNYDLVKTQIKERANELIKAYLDIDFDERIEVTNIFVNGDNIIFHYNILDEYGSIRYYLQRVETSIDNFCSDACDFGEMKRYNS